MGTRTRQCVEILKKTKDEFINGTDFPDRGKINSETAKLISHFLFE
jgi:hypothetical protein